MNPVLPLIVFTLCLAIPSATSAITPPATRKAPVPVTMYSPKNAETLVFRGTVKNLDAGNGTVLRTERAVYPLVGGDFAMITGEEVNIIGKMVREGNIEKIVVARVQFDRR